MKKVVLIGASGFVGSAILNEALNSSYGSGSPSGEDQDTK